MHALGKRKSAVYTIHQFRLAEWFFKKIDGTAFHRLYGFRDAAMSGDENDRRRITVRSQVLLKFQPGHVGHSLIQYQAGDPIPVVAFKKFGSGGKTFGLIATDPHRS